MLTRLLLIAPARGDRYSAAREGVCPLYDSSEHACPKGSQNCGPCRAPFGYELSLQKMGGDQTPLLRRRLVPALLLVVPATAAVSASAGIVQAVEECRLEPGWSAPSGSKWLSRINRDHHRCWFLSSRATGHHAQLPRARSVRNRHLAGDTEAARRDPRRDSDLQAASAPIGQIDVAVAAEPPAVLQSTTPPVGQSSANLTARSVPTIAYKVLPTAPKTVLAPTVGAAHVAERAPAQASTKG